ncbi:MAG TPA: type II secretion system protein GspM [Pseudolabrys sp.]|nr:type II secretion system protein GspM [Pseudolabrys sp.]
MRRFDRMQETIARFPKVAAGVYVVVALSLAAGTWSAVANLLDRRADIAAARDVLVQLESQQQRNTHSATIQVPFGSPLLGGTTVTVAGASLLQRVSAAITRLGGNILSSQVELQGVEAKAGFVGVITSCELDQLGLQKLLYELEAGLLFSLSIG